MRRLNNSMSSSPDSSAGGPAVLDAEAGATQGWRSSRQVEVGAEAEQRQRSRALSTRNTGYARLGRAAPGGTAAAAVAAAAAPAG